MNCKKCGAELQEGYRFCSKCGANQGTRVEDFYLCQKCGSKIPNGHKFCGVCGLKQESIEDININKTRESIGSNNIKNLKVRRLTQEDKVRIERERNRMRRYPSYIRTRSFKGSEYWKVGGAVLVLILMVAVGVYFLNTALFNDEEIVQEDVENVGVIEEEPTMETNSSTEVPTDQEALKQLIKDFNDAWIEFINHDNTQIFQYIVPGSEVEENILNFNKQGLKEEFLVMQVGDIEIVGDKAYIKVYEEIKQIRGGTSTVKRYNWIYEADKSSGIWLIRNYTKDQNAS